MQAVEDGWNKTISIELCWTMKIRYLFSSPFSHLISLNPLSLSLVTFSFPTLLVILLHFASSSDISSNRCNKWNRITRGKLHAKTVTFQDYSICQKSTQNCYEHFQIEFEHVVTWYTLCHTLQRNDTARIRCESPWSRWLNLSSFKNYITHMKINRIMWHDVN